MTKIEWFLCACIFTCLVLAAIGPDWLLKPMTGGAS